jgi:alpha-N-arabinofuranosidase
MATVPEFLLRKLYVKDSLKKEANGFSFVLLNSYAPATVTAFALQIDGQPVAPQAVTLQAAESEGRQASDLSADAPFSFPVGVRYTVRVSGAALGQGRLSLRVDTVEAGLLEFRLQAQEKRKPAAPERYPGQSGWRRFWPARPLPAQVRLDAGALIGEIDPFVYGHFIEHLERCIYGGIWTGDGSSLRQDTLELVKDLKPPVIRYPGGNFASGYHWEDGIGPKAQRPPRFDRAWNAWESNQVGTDEFMAYCAQVGAAPNLVVNDGSGTPEEAARWVAYCNLMASDEQGQRRAANGHPEPYHVQLWGVGNEVWGQWQIGTTSANRYAERLLKFIEAMREVDSSIRIVAVGDHILSDAAQDPGRLWNEAVLRKAGHLISDISFHLYQPNQQGWQEAYDPVALHHTVCAAPLSAERIIQRMAAQAAELVPGRKIGIVFDEWNLWLAPPEGAQSMHQLIYTLRDGLYAAGMLNVFHRQCRSLTMANLAQLVNVLPAIVTNDQRAYATPLYYAFWLYQHMQPLALLPLVQAAAFDSQELGNIPAEQGVPYLDVTATRNPSAQQLSLGVVNRHPLRAFRTEIVLQNFPALKPLIAWQLSGPDPLAANDFENPRRVSVKPVALPKLENGRIGYDFPAASVTVLSFGVV